MVNIGLKTLQWAAGTYSAIVGAVMLIAPHQFEAPAYAMLQADLPGWGLLFLMAGFLLLATVALQLPFFLSSTAHLFGSVTHLSLAWGFAAVAGWTGTAVYSVVGFALLVSAFVRPPLSGRPGLPRLDLFILAVSMASILLGLVNLLLAPQLTLSLYDSVRVLLPLLGSGFLLGGLGLLGTHLHPAPHRGIIILIHGFIAAVFLIWMYMLGVRTQSLTAITFYGTYGLLLAFYPALRPVIYHHDPKTLKTRVAFVLTTLTAIPLVFATSLITQQQERLSLQQALTAQETLATSLAQDIQDYVALHRSALAALAAQPGLLELPPATQRTVLQAFNRAYPETYAFMTVSSQGDILARSDDRPLANIRGLAVFEQTLSTLEPAFDVIYAPTIERPLFSFTQPVLSSANELQGVIGSGLDTDHISRIVNQVSHRISATAYIVDASGRIIAHPDTSLAAAFTELADDSPIRTLLNSAADSGVLRYDASGGTQLVGYAQIADLNWGVIIEQPRSVALAPLWTGRELAFGLFLLGSLIAVLMGTLLAGALAAPLATLARAAEQFSTSESVVSLPQSRVTEIAHLTQSFNRMQLRLAQRTAERAQAEREVRLLNEQLEKRVAERTVELEGANRQLSNRTRELETVNRELESFSYTVSHDLRAPLRGVDGYSQALLEDYRDTLEPQAQRYLERISKAAQYMGELIDALLSLSRVTRGELHYRQVDLGAMASSIASELQAESPARQATFVIAENCVTTGDPHLLHAVLKNLLENAWKFTSKKPCTLIELGVQRQGNEDVFFVRDNGAGFDMAYANKLFNPFQRLHNPSEFEGTGIGLATVQRIINRHGGRIWTESKPGEGTTFFFTLAARAASQEQASDTVPS